MSFCCLHGFCTFTVKLISYILHLWFYSIRISLVIANIFLKILLLFYLFEHTYSNYKDFPLITDHFYLWKLSFPLRSSTANFLTVSILRVQCPRLKKYGLSSHCYIIYLEVIFLIFIDEYLTNRNYVYLRCTNWCFYICIHCEIIAAIKLINIYITSHSFHPLSIFLCGENT